MKVIIDIPEDEFGIDIQDKFQEFFERVKVDIGHRIVNNDTLLCGNYEWETAEMFLASFKRMQILPDKLTNGDMIKAMFPNIEIEGIGGLEGLQCVAVSIGLGTSYFSLDWWNSPYKKEVEE